MYVDRTNRFGFGPCIRCRARPHNYNLLPSALSSNQRYVLLSDIRFPAESRSPTKFFVSPIFGREGELLGGQTQEPQREVRICSVDASSNFPVALKDVAGDSQTHSFSRSQPGRRCRSGPPIRTRYSPPVVRRLRHPPPQRRRGRRRRPRQGGSGTGQIPSGSQVTFGNALR